MKAYTNFLGIPVEGDISRGSERVAQKPLSELEPLLRAVLDDPFIASFGWDQYTPFFNDGDACVFSAQGAWFRTTADPAPEEEDGDYGEIEYGGHPSLGSRDYDWVDRARVYHPYKGEHEATYMACVALSQAIESGHFDDVLLEAFGDHAEVMVRRDGISVSTFEHD